MHKNTTSAWIVGLNELIRRSRVLFLPNSHSCASSAQPTDRRSVRLRFAYYFLLVYYLPHLFTDPIQGLGPANLSHDQVMSHQNCQQIVASWSPAGLQLFVMNHSIVPPLLIISHSSLWKSEFCLFWPLWFSSLLVERIRYPHCLITRRPACSTLSKYIN